MFESKGKIKTRELLRHIIFLEKSSSDRVVEGFGETEKELIKKITIDTEDFIDHDEWGIGLEHLLDTIYEIGFRLDMKAVDLAKDAIKACEMRYEDWAFIEELVK